MKCKILRKFDFACNRKIQKNSIFWKNHNHFPNRLDWKFEKKKLKNNWKQFRIFRISENFEFCKNWILHATENCANVSLQWNPNAFHNSDVRFRFGVSKNYNFDSRIRRTRNFLKNRFCNVFPKSGKIRNFRIFWKFQNLLENQLKYAFAIQENIISRFWNEYGAKHSPGSGQNAKSRDPKLRLKISS